MTRASGSLFGLAYGDALGRPTEFLSVPQIVQRYGPDGPRDLPGDPALVTDDTQMALAVAWALHDALALAAAPARAERAPANRALTADALEPRLRQRFVTWALGPHGGRAPGRTCLRACAALQDGYPWQRAAVADSKGCGTVMRVAPVGLVPGIDEETLAGVAQLQAGMTHGHPTALAAAELMAYAVKALARDGVHLADLPGLLRDRCRSQRDVYRDDWLDGLWDRPGATTPDEFIAHGWDECLTAVRRLEAALVAPDHEADPCDATGEGWVADEAVATGVLCALLYPDDPVSALARAARTRGDSDTIACVAGALLGAAHGSAAWPQAWAGRIEYGDELRALGAAWD
jgi:ADP-ribosylglycohydrolase